ncbi:hypothetical protein TWF192_006966 [Orbilia oligospora]|nr:hypothetical protein TWF192_006966 [Orbilia oligospora]
MQLQDPPFIRTQDCDIPSLDSINGRYIFYGKVVLGYLVLSCAHCDEFSNNLFSDLAPLLALFGEQVAKQYLSQSLSWLDCIIFAMAPLGIITAIVSAIRVAGPIWLRAVIGRARESKGDAELELMSSTSIDVCELWNGRSVVRAIGESDITEVFWLEEVDSKPPNPEVTLEQNRTPTVAYVRRLGSLPTKWYQRLLAKLFPTPRSQQRLKLDKPIGTIFSAREAQNHRLLYQLRHPDAKTETNQTNEDTESKGSSDFSEEKPNPPNISLNILGDPTSKLELVLVACTTTVLQLGVVAFQITITYFSPFNRGFTKGGNPPASYACPLTVAGTLLVMIGMFICAMVVQLKSREDKWYFCDNIVIDSQRYKLKLGWLQRHQRVMDQTFDGYCLYPPETRRKVLYSHFDDDFKSQHFWTVIGTSISVVGFVLQFTGLRGMNYLASLLQLGAIGVVTLLRVMIRRHLNDKPKTQQIENGYELEWMAKRLSRCSHWSVRNLINTSDNLEEEGGDFGTFDARRKLQDISKWPPENASIKKHTDSLARAIKEVTEYLHRSDIKLNDKAQNDSTFEFTIPIAYSSTRGHGGSINGTIRITMEMKIPDIPDSSNTWADWEIDKRGIEAVLTLWASSDNNQENKKDGGNLILLGPSSEFSILDYEMFISHETPCLKLGNGLDDLMRPELRIYRDRVFGYVGPSEAEEHLAFKTSMDLPELRARHILTCCLNQLFQNIEDFNGQTTWSRGTASSIGAGISPSTPILQMGNSHLDRIIDILHNSGIDGTRQELLTVLIPTLQKNENLLRISDAFSKVIEDAKVAESSNSRPQVSMEEIFSHFLYAVRIFRKNHHWFYVGDILFSHPRVCRMVFGDQHKWTKLANSLVSQICCSIEAQIYYEIEFRDGGDYDRTFWSKACSNLLLRCLEALGGHTNECKLFQRLLTRAKALKPINPTQNHAASSATVREPSSNKEFTPVESPITSPGAIPTITVSSPIPRTMELNMVYELETADRLKGPFSAIKSNVELVSRLLVDAARLGHPKVVASCMTELLEAFSRSALPIEKLESTISEAASASVESERGGVIDILLSVLSGDKAMALYGSTARSGPNHIQSFFETGLRTACRKGATEIVHLLLSNGIDPSCKVDGKIETLPLYLAAAGGFADIIALILYYSVTPAHEGPEGAFPEYTFLHHAAAHGAEAAIDIVASPTLNLQWRLWLLSTRDNSGHYALEVSIIGRHEAFAIRIFETMIKYRQWSSWETELKEDSRGQSPLHLACTHDLPELATILITYGFQPRAVDGNNHSAFQIAAASGSCKVGMVLLDYDKQETISQYTDASPILLAISNDQAHYVKLLLDNGVSIETRDPTTGCTPLLAAAANGKDNVIELLLKRGADIEAHDPTTGYTPLLAAVVNRRANTTKFLLERGANTLAKDLRGRTFTQLAITSGALEVLDILFNNQSGVIKQLLDPALLLSDGEDGHNSFYIYELLQGFMTSQPSSTENALTNLFFKPYVDEINLLLPKPPANIGLGFSKHSAKGFEGYTDLILRLFLKRDLGAAASALDEKGNSLLVYAAGTGSRDTCERLLKYMKSDSHKKQLERALHLAFYGGRLDIVEILVEAGIQTNRPLQGSGLTPLSLLLRIAAVTRKNHGSWQEMLLGDETSDMGLAPWENDFDLLNCLKLFIHPGIETKPTTEELEKEQSVLHLAIMCKSPEVFAAIIKAGTDINLPPQAKRPLLHFALSYESGDPGWIPVLCSYGIDINAVDKDGKTALIIEIEKSKASTANILIENGATWGRGEKFKAPEPIKAIKLGSSSLFSFLCKRHKRVKSEEYQNYINTPGVYGSCPVHVAAKHHNDKILEFLWLEGADMHAKDKQGRNALSYALESQSTMQLLVKLCRIDPNERLTEKQYTAAHIAVRTIQDPAQIAKTLQDLWNLGADFNIKDKAGKTPADYASFASRRPKFQIRSVLLPNKSSKVEWEENVELCRQINQKIPSKELEVGISS